MTVVKKSFRDWFFKSHRIIPFDSPVVDELPLFKDDKKVVGTEKPEEKKVQDNSDCKCLDIIDEEVLKTVFLYKGSTHLFGHKNMKSYDTYKTEISVFITKLKEIMKKYEINNCLRKAHFLAQIWWETDRFNTLQEYASGNHYNPGNHPQAKKNGNTKIGDGPKYKGRGCMQLTWKNNYRAYAKYVDQEQHILANSQEIASSLHYAVDSAGWYWKYGKKYRNGSTVNFNDLADRKKTDLISVYVNGGGNGKSERRAKTNKLIKLFNASEC